MKKIILLNALLCLVGCAPSDKGSADCSGICAHLSRWEFPKAKEEIKLMREAGIGMFRTGFDWGDFEGKQREEFNSRWDSICQSAKDGGVDVLAIGAPKYAQPFPKCIDKIAIDAEKAAARFKGKIKYWEMTNEPNSTFFWAGLKPDPVEYGKLMKAVYPAIKRANPEAVVLYAGVSGVPIDYIDKSLENGGAQCFDVMNVHPYNWRGFPEDLLKKELSDLRKVMKKHGVDKKPIWITEVGYTSAKPNSCQALYIERALSLCGVDVRKVGITYLGDEKYDFYADAFLGDVRMLVPSAKEYRRITFAKLANLSPLECPALFLGACETFPYEYFSALKKYLTDGGVVVTAGRSGRPFTFKTTISNGDFVFKHGGKKIVELMKELRIAVKMGNDPEIKSRLVNVFGKRGFVSQKESAKGFEDIKPVGEYKGNFFASDEACGKFDKFIPIVNCVFGEKKYPLGAIYKYGGDMKGAFIAFFAGSNEDNSEEMQAKMFSRQHIIARSCGIERVFQYCFRSSERDNLRESHFGIIRKNLEPKPAYFACKTVNKMLGSALPSYRRDGLIYIAEWVRPDGVPVCALWTKIYDKSVKISCEGVPVDVCGYLGETAKYKRDGNVLSLDLGGGVTYITGIKNPKVIEVAERN